MQLYDHHEQDDIKEIDLGNNWEDEEPSSNGLKKIILIIVLSIFVGLIIVGSILMIPQITGNAVVTTEAETKTEVETKKENDAYIITETLDETKAIENTSEPVTETTTEETTEAVQETTEESVEETEESIEETVDEAQNQVVLDTFENALNKFYTERWVASLEQNGQEPIYLFHNNNLLVSASGDAKGWEMQTYLWDDYKSKTYEYLISSNAERATLSSSDKHPVQDYLPVSVTEGKRSVLKDNQIKCSYIGSSEYIITLDKNNNISTLETGKISNKLTMYVYFMEDPSLDKNDSRYQAASKFFVNNYAEIATQAVDKIADPIIPNGEDEMNAKYAATDFMSAILSDYNSKN